MERMGDSPGRPTAYRARWIVPVRGEPIDGGVVAVAGRRIVRVGRKESDLPVIDLGDVALLPGLVNAHTHLEFSHLDRPLGHAGIGFAQWIGLVRQWRIERGADRLRSAIDRGLAESSGCAVAAVGEIATGDWSPATMPSWSTMELVAYRELLGLAAERIEPLLALANEHVAACSEAEGSLQAGISPHAPYTVHPELLARVCDLSALRRIPLAMHLAETREELELLRSHTGSLVELLQGVGAWLPDVLPAGRRPLDYLNLLSRAHRCAVIHGNYLATDEITFIAQRRERMSVVYCPRTHAYFGHEPYPLGPMLAAGVRVAVGTDSRASNPDLNVLADLCHVAAHHPEVAPHVVLRLGTQWGAEALGVASQYGTIEVGKSARLAVVPVDPAVKSAYEAIFSSATGSARPLAQFAV